MRPDRRRYGRRGEYLAALHLVLRGYRIVARNRRTPFAEVDLVCRRGDLLLVVEVKRRRADRGRSARRALGDLQAGRLARAAIWLRNGSGWARRTRVDLVAIDGWRVKIIRNVVDFDTRLPPSMRGWA
jgi:putative endonuclease